MLSIADICTWAEANPSSRNFIEGVRLLSSKHVIYCGKSAESDSQCTKISAFCLQTSSLKERPHEINCQFGNNGQILSVKCSCKAGLSQKCKHAVAVLLFCNRTRLEDLESTSCTDKKCLWNSRQKQSLDNLYNPRPLTDHNCFKDCKDNKLEISDDLKEIMREKLIACNSLSALAKHASGRHTSVIPCAMDSLSEAQRHEIKIIICNSESSLMENLAEIPFKPLRICCKTVLGRLDVNALRICEESAFSYATWKKERQFRITGSRCYDLYTYISNKKPNWPKRSMKYFYSKTFSNQFIKHGLEFEASARVAYEGKTSERVIKCGLVVSHKNSFLAYSPDGIVFKNGMPHKLIEIKCPFSGKTMSISESLPNINFLIEKDGNISMKKKHKYYTQIQFGMAVLDIKQTDFIIYASFDNSSLVLSVDLDQMFISTLLPSLKVLYFTEMLHQICLQEKL